VLKDDFGYLHKRTKKKIIKLPYINLKKENAMESVYFQKIFLFVPWRDESELIGSYSTYKDAYDNINSDDINMNILQTFEQHRKKTDDIINSINKIKYEQSLNTNKKEETIFNEKDLGITDFCVNIIDEKLLKQNVSLLNVEQKEIFDNVMKQIESNDSNNKKLRLFCSGVGGNLSRIKLLSKILMSFFLLNNLGTGKSYLINCVRETIMSKYKSLVNEGWLAVVLAPTGMSAFNINGITIHRCFNLPIFTKSSRSHWSLSNNAVKLIRHFVKNIKLIIIGSILFTLYIL